MLQKPLLIRLCVVVWVLFCGVFTVLRKPVLVRLCCYVGMFCGVFLSVAETIVGLPVCCSVGIVLWIKLTLKTVDEDPASCKRWISRKEIKSAKI